MVKRRKRMSFEKFQEKILKNLYSHPVIQNNPYTKWFKNGEAGTEQVKDLVVQFSVFSNYFVPIQAKRMANALNEASERGARAILVSEVGVVINSKTGDVEGNIFHHKNAHVELLRDIGDDLGLNREFVWLGHWTLGNTHTHKFLKDLEKVYGSFDCNIGAGASFAIESWAGFGIGKGKESENNNFWKELIVGLNAYNDKAKLLSNNLHPLDISFFTYHFALESGHVASVESELEEIFANQDFNAQKWFYGAKKALDAIYIFWQGLDESRKTLA